MNPLEAALLVCTLVQFALIVILWGRTVGTACCLDITRRTLARIDANAFRAARLEHAKELHNGDPLSDS